MMQWNLSYQRQVARDWFATVNYLGNASRHIWGSIDVNYAVQRNSPISCKLPPREPFAAFAGGAGVLPRETRHRGRSGAVLYAGMRTAAAKR
jgi:hypothetical protein